VLHFIPTSSSWLNLVERWFAEPGTCAEDICGSSYELFGRALDLELALEVIRKAAVRSHPGHSKFHEACLRGERSHADAARELGITEGAFKVAHHRFRERLSGEIWTEVSKLVGPDDQEVQAEIAYLMSLFAEGRE
jgi:hypothetical protein